MNRNTLKQIICLLIALLTAGLAIAVAAGIFEWIRLSDPDGNIPILTLSLTYILTGLVFGLIGLAISRKVFDWGMKKSGSILKGMEKLPFPQLMSAVICMILGFIVAALLTNILTFMGSSIFTTVFCALLYVILGTFGYTFGYVRAQDFHTYLRAFATAPSRTFHRKTQRASRKVAALGAPDKLLDSSVLIDGRIVDLCRLGFIEGDLIVPDFITEELHILAESQDSSRHARGQRGLESLSELQKLSRNRIRTMHESSDDALDTDVRLLRLSRETGAVTITCDTSLAKIAAVSSLPVLNIHELSDVLRPIVLPGQAITARIVREGREAGQGIAYMDDGTMIVVENGKDRVGETLDLIVTSALQTHAGRMIFARQANAEV